MDWKAIINLLPGGARYIFIATIVAWSLLLLPQQFIQFLGLQDLLTKHRFWIGSIALGGLAYLVGSLLFDFTIWLFNTLKDRRYSNQQRRKLEEGLHKLTPEEKLNLQEYISRKTQTRYFRWSNGVAIGLVNKGYLYEAFRDNDPNPNRAFNMHHWVYEYLSEHPQLVGIKPIDSTQS